MHQLKAEDLQGLDAESARRVAGLLLERVGAMAAQISSRDDEIRFKDAKPGAGRGIKMHGPTANNVLRMPGCRLQSFAVDARNSGGCDICHLEATTWKGRLTAGPRPSTVSRHAGAPRIIPSASHRSLPISSSARCKPVAHAAPPCWADRQKSDS